MSESKIVPYSFDGNQIEVIQADEIMMTDRQLGEALGYAKGGRAISDIAAAHADELEHFQTVLDLRTVDGKTRSVRVWREQGVYLLTMFSNQPKAKSFRQFAAQTLYAVRRNQPVIAPAGGMPEWAAMLMQQLGGGVLAVQQQQAAQQTQINRIEQSIQNVQQNTAQEVIERLQRVDTLKTHLHDLVCAIVAKASELPSSDGFGWQYSKPWRVWPAVHGYAMPRVSSKAEYRTPEQVAAAIKGAEMILTKLGGDIPPRPEQMEIVFVDTLQNNQKEVSK